MKNETSFREDFRRYAEIYDKTGELKGEEILSIYYTIMLYAGDDKDKLLVEFNSFAAHVCENFMRKKDTQNKCMRAGYYNKNTSETPMFDEDKFL